MAEILLAGALWRSAIGKMLLAWGAATRGDVVARGRAVARCCTVAEILLPGRPIGMKMLAGDALAELLLAGHLRKRHLLPVSI